MKLRPLYLGASIGIVWGGSLFITTWLSYFTGYGELFLKTMAQSIYPGYSITPLGSFLGLVYGFIDGLVSGAIVAFIYNRLIERGNK
ncbi:MAG TPA: hypothetical protein ENK09_10830 [Nitrospirae bacterium]|nr:hypothetical protein [Nitrospirota bacterium]